MVKAANSQLKLSGSGPESRVEHLKKEATSASLPAPAQQQPVSATDAKVVFTTQEKSASITQAQSSPTEKVVDLPK